MMKWVEGSYGDKVAVAPCGGTCSIYAARADGSLDIYGDLWKGKRPPARLDDQRMAVRVAEKIQRFMVAHHG